MLKKLIFIFLVSIFAITVKAQQIKVSGVVNDAASHKRIGYATISFDKTTHFSCDSNGHFTGAIFNGSYTVIIEAPGYKSEKVVLDC